MKDHPILFSGPLVRAILSGEKTQTRRLLRVQPDFSQPWYPLPYSKRSLAYDGERHFRRGVAVDFAPWKVGDRLWVREAFGYGPGGQGDIRYRADGGAITGRWTPSIHMPRTASRISLEVTKVRVQRLQDISEEDAQAEGVGEHPAVRSGIWPDRAGFGAVWDTIASADQKWSANPWVWAITFRRVQP